MGMKKENTLDISVSEAFELYRLEHIVYRNQSSKTEEMNRCAAKQLISFAGDIPLKDLNFEIVRKWKENMSYDKSAGTVRGYLICLRVVLKHCRLRGYECINHELVGIPKRTPTPIDFLAPEEVERLIDCVFEPQAGYRTVNRYRNRAIVAVLYASGIRVSELCKLNKTSIRSDGSFTIIGKGNKQRLCFLDERAMQYIKEYLEVRTDQRAPLFMSHQIKERITPSIVQMIFRHATSKMGFDKPIHPHMLRHSFATNLLRNNTNLYYVSKFLGHSSVQTTQVYTHYTDEDLRAIYKEKHSV